MTATINRRQRVTVTLTVAQALALYAATLPAPLQGLLVWRPKGAGLKAAQGAHVRLANVLRPLVKA